ncbi:MORN repeat-containing protein 2 isoform X5 [Pygocentrus nattereri]|uniref:MORN repeat-containing protein 2 isoform X5 n=1 Tax=Pygocentrus nattereri TaxID=42514 RepID=UPI0018917F03|nr:MORN repeat-containing protein 2 isoform X5 [Pygocentrus nattereri]
MSEGECGRTPDGVLIRQGIGTQISSSGTTYTGEWSNDKARCMQGSSERTCIMAAERTPFLMGPNTLEVSTTTDLKVRASSLTQRDACGLEPSTEKQHQDSNSSLTCNTNAA